MSAAPVSGDHGLLDTGVVIALPRLTEPSALPRFPHISAVTPAELSVGPLVARTPEERAARQAVLQQAEADFDPLPFDAPAARASGASPLPRDEQDASRTPAVTTP